MFWHPNKVIHVLLKEGTLFRYTPQPFSNVLFDLYHIICSVFLLSTLPVYHAFVENTV